MGRDFVASVRKFRWIDKHCETALQVQEEAQNPNYV